MTAVRWSQTARGRAVFAAQARSRFDAGEAELRPHVDAAIRAYLAKLRSVFAARGGKYLTAAAATTGDGGDFSEADADGLIDVLDQADVFGTILDQTIMPALRASLIPILKSGMGNPNAKSSLIAWRNQWLADRRQVLVDIPNAITDQLRTALRGAASVNGTSVDDARNLVQNMLDDGYPSWSGRAQLIARTETVGANNQGSLASMTSLADANGMTATKTWLATEDAATREDHADVDGTTVGLGDTFSVGEDDMSGPGDSSASAGNLCNCRCTLTYDFQSASGDQAGSVAADDPSSIDDAADLPDDAETDDQLAASAAADAPPTGVAIMGRLAPADAERFAVDGGEPADSMHVTLGYLAQTAAEFTDAQHAALMSALAPVAASMPVAAKAFAVAQFNPNDPDREPCAVVLVQSDELAALHDAVEHAISTTDTDLSTSFPTWIPHVTVAYDAGVDAVRPEMVGSDLTFDQIIVGVGGMQHVVGQVDPPDDNDGDQLTAAAPEAAVTAPTTPAPAAPAEATGGDTATPAVSDAALEPEGITWSGPLALLDTPSSDGRVISATGGTIRPLPQALSWQEESAPEHDGSIAVGRILSVEVRGNVLWGTGDWLDPNVTFDVGTAMAQVDAGLGFISVDLAVSEIGYADENGMPIDPMLYDGDGTYEVALAWELGGATILTFPAFADARITNEIPADETVPIMEAPIMPALSGTQTFAGATPESPTISEDGMSITLQDGTSCAVGDPIAWSGPDGTTIVGAISGINSEANEVTVTPPLDDDGVTQPPDETVSVTQLEPVPAGSGKPGMAGEAGLVASAAVQPYHAPYFAMRKFDGPHPITVDPDTGAVFGHLAQDGQCHLGKLAETGKCVTLASVREPNDNYDYFNVTALPTDDGQRVLVGRITVGTGHYGPGSYRGSVEHYDNTGTQAAVVHAYKDEWGIQVAGQLIHGVEPSKAQALAQSGASGDWRRTEPGGPLRLVAALSCNVAGFQIVPKVLNDYNGDQVGLVASGYVQPLPAKLGEIVLPSGKSIPTDDFEALVAACMEAATKHAAKRPAGSDELARARARLALIGSRRRVS